jgi:hypothetical protein
VPEGYVPLVFPSTVAGQMDTVRRATLHHPQPHF